MIQYKAVTICIIKAPLIFFLSISFFFGRNWAPILTNLRSPKISSFFSPPPPNHSLSSFPANASGSQFLQENRNVYWGQPNRVPSGDGESLAPPKGSLDSAVTMVFSRYLTLNQGNTFADITLWISLSWSGTHTGKWRATLDISNSETSNGGFWVFSEQTH